MLMGRAQEKMNTSLWPLFCNSCGDIILFSAKMPKNRQEELDAD
jgi:hypothetical protein